MKRYVLALLGLALVSGATVLAGVPTGAGAGVPLPPGQPAVGQPAVGQPVVGQPVVGQPVVVIPGPVVGPDCAPAHGCARGHCVPHECVPEHYIKTTKKVVFSSRCEPQCLPPCHGCCVLHKQCGEGHCAEGQCHHPCNVRYLVKKRIACEEEATRCVPHPCGHGRGCAGGVYPPIGEPMPAPKIIVPSKK